MTEDLWPLVFLFIVVLALEAAMLGLSWVAGEKRVGRAGLEPFESGIVPVGNARMRMSMRFYVVAILFVIFDLEAVFLIAWAVAFREAGWFGYVTMLVFVFVLTVALIYEWKRGALDWGPRDRSTRS